MIADKHIHTHTHTHADRQTDRQTDTVITILRALYRGRSNTTYIYSAPVARGSGVTFRLRLLIKGSVLAEQMYAMVIFDWPGRCTPEGCKCPTSVASAVYVQCT